MDWEKVTVHIDTTIREAINLLDKSALQIVLVIDEEGKLLGTITDGDIRRGLLSGVNLDSPVKQIYYVSPLTASIDDLPEELHQLMKTKYIKQMPVLDHDGKVVRLELLSRILKEPKIKSPVLLMAGGLGSRLSPLTDNCPKPLLKVGGKPLLETILENFIKDGFEEFYISINYKGEMIEEHFGDGSAWGVSINYLRETSRLGTAGCLSLLPERPEVPFLVMNGDLLTKVNFKKLLEFHNNNHTLNHAPATMCVREYNLQIPYGVVIKEGNRLKGLDEKPVQRFFVNAGIYVFEPEVLDLIPSNEMFDMTHLFDKLFANKQNPVIFQIREYWMDIGQRKDFETAEGEYNKIFLF